MDRGSEDDADGSEYDRIDRSPSPDRKRPRLRRPGSPVRNGPAPAVISPAVVAPSGEPLDAATLLDRAAAQPQWQRTIQSAVKAIVSLRFCQVTAFDTEGPMSSEASGFVVDAERGIILTNRHVTCSGPFVGEACFHNHEEVPVWPVYRDPIHDFGFLRFNPAEIRYMALTAIPLAPALAKVGLDIRVVGNDAGEKLSILAGSISRLDRNAPVYGELTYNDFNTFYMQAASSASGGSSGSPVLEINGSAVALQAGGSNRAATDFFFPLDRVTRALAALQEDAPVPRGTIQTQFMYRPFDEVRRLGLQDATEAMVRAAQPDEIGMLTVETVVPEGPAHDKLEEGDVLVRANGQLVTKFVPLEAMVDDLVGQTLTLEIERGGEPMTFEIAVGDLHAITPDRYVEMGGARLNNLSYQLARFYAVPCKGVYVAEPSGMFRLEGREHGWVVSSVDGKPTPDLDAFIDVMKQIPDMARIAVTYYSIADIHWSSVAIVDVDRHWTSFRLAVRNDQTGIWDFHRLGDPLPPKPLTPITAGFQQLDASLGPAKEVFRSMVKVHANLPCPIEGFPKTRKQGAGLILDAERGLVVVSRNIIPFTLGDFSLTFADSIILPGKVEFLHPLHNFAIVSYDPRLIGDTPVQSATLSEVPLGQGHATTLAAMNHNYRPICNTTVVTDITTVTIPSAPVPRFRAVNFDAITVDTPLAQHCSSGVLCDADGRVQALWLSHLGDRNGKSDTEYYLGIHIALVKPILERFQQHVALPPVPPTGPVVVPPCDTFLRLWGFAIEVVPVQMSTARQMGVTDDWVRRVEAANPQRHQLFMVRRTEAQTPTAEVLHELDLILAVRGRTVAHIHDLEVQYTGIDVVTAPVVPMTVLRNKQELALEVPLTRFESEGTRDVLMWSGAILQEPHRAVRQQSKRLPKGVYVSATAAGSPAVTHGLVATNWITHVNKTPTPTLAAFKAAVAQLPDMTYVRVKSVTFDLVTIVLSIKQHLHYWPTVELVRDRSASCGWARQVLASAATTAPLAAADKARHEDADEDAKAAAADAGVPGAITAI